MGANDYYFIDYWRVTGSADQVFALLSEGMSYPRWCPKVYQQAKLLTPGDANGLGETTWCVVRGPLPYTITVTFRRVEIDRPRRVVFRAEGGFDGWATWTVKQEGDEVVAALEWRLKAEKPLLRILSPILKPLFKANHRWTMAMLLEALKIELAG